MFIKKKDYEALVADMERLYKEYKILGEFRREIYKACRITEEQYEDLSAYTVESKELHNIIVEKLKESEN